MMAGGDITQLVGVPAGTRALEPDEFLKQYVLPLFLPHHTRVVEVRSYEELTSEQQFWEKSGRLLLGGVSLRGFRLSDWLPRTPGVYWSPSGFEVRREILSYPVQQEPGLGIFYPPLTKKGLIERGGLGSIRLRPRRVDGVDYWLGTAGTGSHCHSGIPVAIPDMVLRQSGIEWGAVVNLKGQVRFLQDAGLDDIANSVSGARPLIVFVEQMEGTNQPQTQRHTIISPVIMFSGGVELIDTYYSFVQCTDGADSELDHAVEWFHRYTAKYGGKIITNFDEQRPVLANAPLSYQRLINKSYDRAFIQQFTGTMIVQRLDALVHEETNIEVGELTMGHKVITGMGNVNIDSNLNLVDQRLTRTEGDQVTREEFEAAIQSLRNDLQRLSTGHPEEAKLVSSRLDALVAESSKPDDQQKKNLLGFSAKGLTEAAEFVKNIAPNILTTATLVAKFITG